MITRYFCLDNKYLIADTEWSAYEDSGVNCYVRAEDYAALHKELDALRETLQYTELLLNKSALKEY